MRTRPRRWLRLSAPRRRRWTSPTRAPQFDLTGLNGSLNLLTSTVLQAALDEEMTEHLGDEKHCNKH